MRSFVKVGQLFVLFIVYIVSVMSENILDLPLLCPTLCPTSQPDCPESMLTKCAKAGGLYCEENQNCYTPVTGESKLQEARDKCASLNGVLPKYEDINTPESLNCLNNSVVIGGSDSPFSYWSDESDATPDQCEYFNLQSYSDGRVVATEKIQPTCPNLNRLFSFCVIGL